MANADFAKIGGANGAVGPLLMKNITPAAVELRDVVMDENKIYEKVLFQEFEE